MNRIVPSVDFNKSTPKRLEVGVEKKDTGTDGTTDTFRNLLSQEKETAAEVTQSLLTDTAPIPSVSGSIPTKTAITRYESAALLNKEEQKNILNFSA